MLTAEQIGAILETACILLEKKGALVENAYVRERLEAMGGRIEGEIVRFPTHVSRDALAWGTPVPPPEGHRVTAYAEVYQGSYLSLDGEYVPLTHARLLEYLKLTRHLPGIDGIYMLGCPIEEAPLAAQSLYEKLYCWNWGIDGGQAIWDTALCPKLLRLWQRRADQLGKPLAEIFQGTVYMISPLKIGAVEGAQMEFFARQGLTVHLGCMGSLGCTAPVTLAGALAMQLAEKILCTLWHRSCGQYAPLGAGNAMAVMDMRTAAFRYGRPEEIAMARACDDIAAHLGLPRNHHGGLTDARTPGFEAGAQKAASAMTYALSSGHGNIAAGLLAVDTVFSPVQLALDGELARSLNAALQDVTVDAETLALETMLDVEHGGMFLDQEHTAEHLRELWQPRAFSRELTGEDARTAEERARDLCRSILAREEDPQPLLDPVTYQDMTDIINSKE